MSWADILKNKKKYHVTTREAVPKIIEEGIKPRGSPKSILRASAWTFTNLRDAKEYLKHNKRNLDVILEIEPDSNIKFERGPDELVGPDRMSAKRLETSVAKVPITGKIKVAKVINL